MRRLGLKFGALPPSLQPRLLELFRGHEQAAAAGRGERGAVAAVAADVAAELPGGWSDKQVGFGGGGLGGWGWGWGRVGAVCVWGGGMSCVGVGAQWGGGLRVQG